MLRLFRYRILMIRFDAKQAKYSIFSLPSEKIFAKISLVSLWNRKRAAQLPMQYFLVRLFSLSSLCFPKICRL
jgi:hypothetical protein